MNKHVSPIEKPASLCHRHVNGNGMGAANALLLFILCCCMPLLAIDLSSPVSIHCAQEEMNAQSYLPWPHKLMEFAVNDFAEHLKLAVHREFRINPPSKERQRILIGKAAVKEYNLQKESDALQFGTYTIQTKGDDLLIYGHDAEGSINGMYSFLERHLSIRWFGPTDDFRIVPDAVNSIFANINETEKPDYLTRDIESTIPPRPIDSPWGIRNRLFKSARTWDMTANHNFYRIYPGAVYGKTHPEYYSMNADGRRMIPPEYTQVCFSNPDVLKIASQSAENFFKEGVERVCFSLCADDNMNFCKCPECKKMQPPRKEDINCYTDAYMEFVERVTDTLKDKYPERRIGFFAYGATKYPPLKKMRNGNYYCIVFTPDFTQYSDREFREKELKVIRDWCSQIPGAVVGWHAYTSLCQISPCYYPSLISEMIKYLHKEFNAISILGDGGVGFWPFTGPQGWMMAKLLWCTETDPEALLNEYFTTLYGPAADDVRSFYDKLEQCYLRGSKTGGKWLRNHGSLAVFDYYTTEDVVFARNAWANARKAAAGHPAILSRISYVTSRMETTLRMMEAWDISKRIAKEEKLPESHGTIDKALDYCVKILDTYEEDWQRIVRTDKALGAVAIQGYRGPSFDYTADVRNKWQVAITSNIIKALVKHPNEARNALFFKNPFREVQFGLETKMYSIRHNVVDNPCFEEGAGVAPDGADWKNSGARGWAFWSETPSQFTYGRTSSGDVAEGKYVGVIRGSGSGILIACPKIDISDGNRYFVAEAKCWKSSEDAKTSIRILWKDSTGKILGGNRFSSNEIADVGSWVHQKIFVEAPQDADMVMFCLSGADLKGSEVRFDEISFRKVSLPVKAKDAQNAEKKVIQPKEKLCMTSTEDLVGVPGVLLKSIEPGCFLFNGKGYVITKDMVSVLEKKDWLLTAEFYPLGDKPSKGVLVGLLFLDANMRGIYPYNENRIQGTTTKLSAPCTFTDKVLKVESSTNWRVEKGAKIAFDSKQDNSDLPNYNLCAKSGIEEISQGEIRMANEIGVEYPAGTLIAEHVSGPTYTYIGPMAAEIPVTGQKLSVRISASDFRKGAEYMQVIVLINEPIQIKNLELKPL